MTKLRKNLTRLDHIGSHFVFLLIINITFITCLSVTSELPNINYNNTDPNAISSPGVCFFVCFVLFCFRSVATGKAHLEFYPLSVVLILSLGGIIIC